MVRPFDNISDKNIKKILQLLETHVFQYKKGQEILSDFINYNVIGIILNGSALIERYNYDGSVNIIDELYEYDIFGTQISSLNDGDYEIKATDDVRLIIIDYDILTNPEYTKFDYYNKFILNMFKIINEKITLKNERIKILTRTTIRNKLLEFFKIEQTKNHSKNIYLPFNYSDLAAYIGSNRSAVSRELSYLKEEGFIEVKGKKITINYL